jgi:ABC-2 type transport system ATP-binding protein
MKYAIQTLNLNVKLEKKQVLRDVTIGVPAGQVVGLLGPSGAGKTTLMRAIVGLQRPGSGTVEVLGLPAGSRELRSRVGYVTQSPSVYPDLTVAENLKFFAIMAGAEPGDVKQVLRDVSLEAQNHQLVGSLSGGQRARVSLAVALLGDPQLLVLDEPTVGLDPVLRRELWEQFHALAKAGTSLLVSSHVMDEAIRCDSLLLLRDGAVLSSGTPHELMKETGAKDVESAFLALVEKKS